MLSVLQSFPAVLYGMHFLQFGWLASCSCIFGAGQLAAAQTIAIQFNCHVDLGVSILIAC